MHNKAPNNKVLIVKICFENSYMSEIDSCFPFLICISLVELEFYTYVNK